MQADLCHVATSFKRLKVDVFDADDRENARAESEERMRKYREEQETLDAGT